MKNQLVAFAFVLVAVVFVSILVGMCNSHKRSVCTCLPTPTELTEPIPPSDPDCPRHGLEDI